jgi:histidyl-tRNA synthetase
VTAKPTPLSGFPEFLPAQRLVERHVIETVCETFELHGFASIETRAVEPLEQLLRKSAGGEIDKEVYVLRRLHAAEDESSTLGLHYDLTVPFARYVQEFAGKLEFPFRRYQIQKAWRGERPQEGRFREFTQADIDVVGRDELAFHHDVEIARVMAEALCRLPVPPLRLQVNNRKLIEGFYRGVGASDPAAVMRVIDKLDKLPAEAIAKLLASDAGLTDEQTQMCLALAEIRTPDTSFVARVRELGVQHELLDLGLTELEAVVTGCAPAVNDRFTIEADLRIARGLDYYTGTVFETRMDGFDGLGSICSGGRYDSLATDGKTTYPGVGISLGISRMLVPLLARGRLAASRSVPSAVLVALPAESDRDSCDQIAQVLRARGIPTEIAPTAAKYGRQIRFAERRGIPFVWFPDSGEVKDIRSGDQLAADPNTWTPPAADLKPQIIEENQ